MEIDCYICGERTRLDIDPNDLKPMPCYTCREIIDESLEELDDEHVYGYDPE